MPRIKKAERDAVVAALQQEHGSVEEAAEAAIEALDGQRAEQLAKPANRPYTLLARDQRMTYSFGPYPTEAQAKRALKRLVSPGPDEMIARIQRLVEVPE